MSMLEHEDTLHDGEFAADDAPTWPYARVREPAPTLPDDDMSTVKTSGMSLAMALTALGLAAFAIGCSESALEKNGENASQTRTITGKLAIASYDGRLDNPVVYAMSAEDEKAYVAIVEPSGKFSLTVAADRTYQLMVANRGAGGRLSVVSQVSWRSGAKIRWAKLSGGPSISIGSVRPVGTAAIAKASYGSDGNENESESESTSGSPSGSISSCNGGSAGSTSGSSSGSYDGCYSDLPYDAKLPLGATYFVEQSFWEKGPSPKKIVKVEVEGGWRAAELQSNTPFVVTQADCDHQGNKDTGRDRIFVTWENFDGSTETDHLDMRYCVNEAWPPAQKTLPDSCTAPKTPSASSAPSTPAPSSCEDESGGSVCTGRSASDSECDAPGEAYEPHESSACEEAAKKTDAPCAAKPAPAPSGSPAPADGPCGCVPEGEVCIENLDCAAGLACFGSICQPPVSSSTIR